MQGRRLGAASRCVWRALGLLGVLWGFWLCRGALGGCAIDVVVGIGIVVHLSGRFSCLWRCAGARLGALFGEEGFMDVKAE